MTWTFVVDGHARRRAGARGCGRTRYALAAIALLALFGAEARAQTTLISGLGGPAGYGTQCLGENDDGSSNAIDITPFFPSGLNFFGTTQTRLFVNTNGNVTFAGGLPTYTPDPFPVAARPMIAPFWADVDTRRSRGSGFFRDCTGPGDGEAVMGPPCDNPTENGVWWHFSPGRAVFTWDRVGYYRCRNDRRMTFQLILSAATGCVGPGDFDVEFRYTRCEWETGDASGGSGGFGGTPAQAGFDAGNTRDYVMIEGSRMAGIARRLCTESNVGIPGTWRFSVRSGVVICPDAGMPCTVPGQRGACAEGRTNCVGMGTECVQQVEPVPERCDNVDNDCDGMTDESDGAPLCTPPDMCVAGVCVPVCFEGGCLAGQTCTPMGCVDDECVAVTCPEGQRCIRGRCVGACDGVRCPYGQTCRGGRCFDPCMGVTCDECSVCDEGACVPHCTEGSCPAGRACGPDRRCVESACLGVSCSAGTYCRGGACVDACEDAACPAGEICRMGRCVPDDRPDAAIGPPDTGLAGLDAAFTPILSDAATGPDGSTRPDRRSGRSGDCGCRVAENSHGPSTLWWIALGVLGGLGAARSRRRR